MASSLRVHLPFRSLQYCHSVATKGHANLRSYLLVRCGPRGNRGPLYKGRTLSIEAIQAVQTLKRAARSDPSNDSISKTLSRLVKNDLVATFNELVRQDQFDLALKVFSAIRSEDWYEADLCLYAKLVTAMAKKGMMDDIDRLIFESIEVVDAISCQGKGLVTLIKALLAADRAEATVRIYEMMKAGGWGCNSATDDYLGKVLSKGLRRLGKKKVADEIDSEIGRILGSIPEEVKL